jgi:hypothetical protein
MSHPRNGHEGVTTTPMPSNLPVHLPLASGFTPVYGARIMTNIYRGLDGKAHAAVIVGEE